MHTLEKNLQQTISDKLQLIGDHYLGAYASEPHLDNFSLLPGHAGCMLVQGIFLQRTGDVRYREALLQTEKFLLHKINASDPLSAVFCDGLAGWGWLMIHLKTQGILPDFDETILEQVDAILEQSLDTMLQKGNYDLFYGALGLGMYFLKRKQHHLVARILSHFSASAVQADNEVRWLQFRPVPSAKPRYDFGLPHGITGILYFVHKCYQANVMPALSEELMKKGIGFFLNNIQDEATVHSFFPYWIDAEQYGKTTMQPVRSRLAWCYGDLGILYTLLQLAKTLQNTALEGAVLQMLLKTCVRRTPQETDVEEPGFCHGASGVGYLYMKLFKQTGHPLFKETADHWYRETCALGNKNGPAGYLFQVGENSWAPASGILEGLGGIALSLLAYAGPAAQDHWDECMFLS
jgi:lantibiotic modifying enzyme